MSSLFATSLYNSFSSAGQYPSSATRNDATAMTSGGYYFKDIEMIKITASRSQIDLFNKSVRKLRRDLNIKVRLTVVVMVEGANTRTINTKGRSDSIDDFLDHIFPEKIPLIHDWLMIGESEVQILRVEGSPEMVDLFNTQVERMVEWEDLRVEVGLISRKKKFFHDASKSIYHAENALASCFATGFATDISMSLDEAESALGHVFTTDFSKSMPTVHKFIMGIA